MKRLPQQSTFELVMESLRGECARGGWNDKLPGARVLAGRLGVSPPTVLKALGHLEQEGVLERPGERKAYRVKPQWVQKQGVKVSKAKKSVLILSHMEISELVDTTRTILERIKYKLVQKGWEVRTQVVNFVHVKTVQKSWDTLIQADENTPVLAVYGRPAIADWAKKNNIKILFLGGTKEGRQVTSVSVSSPDLAEQALSLLVEKGHSKIVLPLNDRAEGFKEKIKQVTRTAVESAGSVYLESYHNPESPYFMPDVIRGMVQSMIKNHLPTAFVFLDWKELVAAHCCLAQAGLRVPQDVSMVLLNDQPEAEWFDPPLDRFRFPSEEMVNQVCKWLEKGKLDSDVNFVPAKYVAGKTVAVPRET
ncbi:hypothetical protein Rhal01_01712 [Rubritalea halochordaticola]|uniref:HTH gntR-type domain-containing protein n=1 Tax=Rubritalea halochordaticola TaxID=714537 RepID=A0ABP9V0V3_9BACT